MRAVKEYLLRIICCGFLVSLCQSVASDDRSKRALKLVGGCMMILVVLRPLTGMDYSALSQVLPELPSWRTEAMEQAEEKNEALLRELIASQTEELIRKKAKSLGLDFYVQVEVEKIDDGVYAPWSAVLSGQVGQAERIAMEQYLSQELGIPLERQKWSAE